MRDHHDVIGGHRHVEFERIDPDRQRSGEPGQRVFGKQAARAAMAVQVDSAFHCHRVGRRLRSRQDAANAAP